MTQWPISASVSHNHIVSRSPSARVSLDKHVATILLFLIFARTLIGLSPMSEESLATRVQGGDLVEQASRFVPFILASMLIARNWYSAIALSIRAWPTLALLVWFGSSVMWSAHPEITLPRAVGTILFAITCFGCVLVIGSLSRAVAVLTSALAITVAINYYAIFAAPEFAYTVEGVRGIHSQKNVTGGVSMLTILFTIFWALGEIRLHRLFLAFTIISASILLLVLSESKTALYLTIFIVVFLPFVLFTRLFSIFASITAIGLITVFSLSIFLIVFGMKYLSLDTAEQVGVDLSFTGRVELWQFVLSEISKNPLLGVGYGAFWDVGRDSDPLLRAPGGSWLHYIETGVINQAHQGYLDIWVQGGIVALVLALWIVAWTTWMSFRFQYSQGVSHCEIMSATAFCLFFLIFIIHNLMESSFWARGQIMGNFAILGIFLIAQFTGRAPEMDRSTADNGLWSKTKIQ